jgi:transcriptional regulator
MYIPAHFRVDDRKVIAGFMRQFDFVALVTNGPAGLVATHVPVLIREAGDDLQIVGHVARGNPHWRLMDGRLESMAIFQGPHAYVSPTWYASSGAVPTWNYAVVHAYGPVRIREDAAFIADVVEELTRRYEDGREGGWSPETLDPDAYQKLLGAIVAIEMPVTRCEAKFKLGQNRSAEDRAGTVAGLTREATPSALEMAKFMTLHRGV